MFRRPVSLINYTSLLMMAVLLLASSVVIAADKPDEGIKIEKVNDQIIITAVDSDGDPDTTVIDLEGIGNMVDEVLGELESTQFQLRLGQDNMLSLAMDDTAIEVDLDLILSQVGMALSQGLDELHATDWANKGPRNESRLADDQLVAELEKLRAEMRSLKKELNNLKSQ